jgi:hypothetical protein
VLCPLCSTGAMSAYEDGFKYPDGLWKHPLATNEATNALSCHRPDDKRST